MAETLVAKARVIVLSKLHGLLDKQVNTAEGFKQHIRDVESAQADLRAGVDEAVGTGNGYKRQITELTGEKASKQADIDLLLGDDDPSNDESALQLQVEVGDMDEQIASLQEMLTANDAETAVLQQAVEQLDHKHDEMVRDLDRITMKEASTKARNRASSALEAAVAVSNNTASVDNIEGRIDHDNDVATARFDRVVGGLKNPARPEEAVKLARAKAALEARRAQIASEAKVNTAPQQEAVTAPSA